VTREAQTLTTIMESNKRASANTLEGKQIYMFRWSGKVTTRQQLCDYVGAETKRLQCFRVLCRIFYARFKREGQCKAHQVKRS